MDKAPALLVALVVATIGVAVVGAVDLVSVTQEIEIGREANAQLSKQTRVLRDREVAAYVAQVGRRLAKHAPGVTYPYSFAVADYRDINAMSLPGGPVWINRGVLAAATNESQVAAVLAHEIAHIAERHAARQLTNALLARWSLSVLGALLGNSGGAGTAQAAGALLAGGAFRKFSRDDEHEADRVGLQIMRSAGWDPHGMVELLETLRRTHARDPAAVQVFFSTHPAPQERISNVSAAVGARRTGVRDSAQFRSIKGRLRRLPPAPAMPAS